MSAVEDILSQIPLGQLAGQLGVNEQEAEQAVRTTLPALLGGIQANTEDPGGAASFAQAVQQHDASLVEGGVDLNQVDPAGRAEDRQPRLRRPAGPGRPAARRPRRRRAGRR